MTGASGKREWTSGLKTIPIDSRIPLIPLSFDLTPLFFGNPVPGFSRLFRLIKTAYPVPNEYSG
jgi:hypothetical protein